MTNGEFQALSTAEHYRGNVSDIEKLKWLATEVIELTEAVQLDDQKKIEEEASDCIYLIFHLFNRKGRNPERLSLNDLLMRAEGKMIIREEFKKKRKKRKN